MTLSPNYSPFLTIAVCAGIGTFVYVHDTMRAPMWLAICASILGAIFSLVFLSSLIVLIGTVLGRRYNAKMRATQSQSDLRNEAKMQDVASPAVGERQD